MQADAGQVAPAGQQAIDQTAFTGLHDIEIRQPVFIGVQRPVVADFAHQRVSLL